MRHPRPNKSAIANNNMSTPLDALSSNMGPVSSNTAPPADEERVRRILAEMNADGVVQPPPGQVDSGRMITEPPVSMSTGQLRMDPGTARANIIGNSQPTMADFHAMLQQAPPGMAPFPVAPPDPGPIVPPSKPGATWQTLLTSAAKGPVAVAIIVFLLNMPIVTSILSRYASWMYLSSGEISIGGLLVKAALAAALFAAYQGATVAF
jgi:hypothetical protein